MVKLTKKGWFIIGVTFGVMDIWVDNLLISFIFGWCFGKLIFTSEDEKKSDKN